MRTCLRIFSFSMIFGLMNAPPIRAQSPSTADAPLPAFEVATIKPNKSGDISTNISPHRYYATDKNARFLINMAYGRVVSRYDFPLADDQVVGGPDWMNSKYYDIDAKVEDSLAEQIRQHPEQLAQQMRLMLQSLLADRFKLQVSHSTNVLPVYALVAAPGGAKFLDKKLMPGETYTPGQTSGQPAPSRGNPCKPKLGWACMATFLSMDDMAAGFSVLPEVRRPVINQTGLTDTYFIQLEYEHTHRPDTMFNAAADNRIPGADAPPLPEASGPSLFAALQKQLGLKLESTKGPVDIIVIDHIEPPSAN
jgi:uncharacterized protein (TIGR03435 family)